MYTWCIMVGVGAVQFRHLQEELQEKVMLIFFHLHAFLLRFMAATHSSRVADAR